MTPAPQAASGLPEQEMLGWTEKDEEIQGFGFGQ